MSCTATPGHFYLDPRSRQVFEVKNVTIWIVEVVDGKKARLLNRLMFEHDCVQVSAEPSQIEGYMGVIKQMGREGRAT